MTDERLKYCQDIIELTNTDSIYSEIGKELLNEIITLQQQNSDIADELSNAREANRIVAELHDKFEQQNKQLVETLEKIRDLDYGTFESDYYKMQEIADKVLKSIQGG